MANSTCIYQVLGIRTLSQVRHLKRIQCIGQECWIGNLIPQETNMLINLLAIYLCQQCEVEISISLALEKDCKRDGPNKEIK